MTFIHCPLMSNTAYGSCGYQSFSNLSGISIGNKRSFIVCSYSSEKRESLYVLTYVFHTVHFSVDLRRPKDWVVSELQNVQKWWGEKKNRLSWYSHSGVDPQHTRMCVTVCLSFFYLFWNCILNTHYSSRATNWDSWERLSCKYMILDIFTALNSGPFSFSS